MLPPQPADRHEQSVDGRVTQQPRSNVGPEVYKGPRTLTSHARIARLQPFSQGIANLALLWFCIVRVWQRAHMHVKDLHD